MYIGSYVNTPSAISNRMHIHQNINQKKLFTEDILQDFFRRLSVPAVVAVREGVGSINPFAGEFVGDYVEKGIDYFVENIPQWHREMVYNRRYTGLDYGIQKWFNDTIADFIISVS